MTIAAFLIGLFLGSLLGFGLCAILVAAGSADRDAEYLQEVRLRDAQILRDSPLIESQEDPR